MSPFKKYNRRQFLQYSAISGAGIAASPMDYFLSGEIVWRRTDLGIYILPPELPNGNAFVYCDEYTEATLKLSEAFSTEKRFPGRVVLVFYKGNLPDQNGLQEIVRKLKTDRNIIWLDSYSKEDVVTGYSSSGIIADDKNHIAGIPRGIGDDVNYQFDLNSLPASPVLEFNAATNTFMINRESKENFILFVNGEKAMVQQMEVPIVHSPSTSFGFHSLVGNTGGSIRFRTAGFMNSASPIQPVSTYIIDRGKLELHHIRYFENRSFSENVSLVITYFPYRKFDNKTPLVTSLECALTTNQPVKTNFINQYGRRFLVKDFSSCICRLTRIDYDTQPKYVFVTGGALNIENNGGTGAHLMLGYSGTERLKLKGKTINLAFVSTPFIKLNNITHQLEVAGSSVTSQVLFDPTEYCLDSDKSPNFNNTDKSFNLATGGRNVSYSPIEVGTMPAKANRKAVALIPTLAFFDPIDIENNKILAESLLLEKTFVQSRLANFDHFEVPDRPATINPHGFLQKDNSYNYIPTVENPKARTPTTFKTVKNNHQQYRFSITNNGNDLDFKLSMSREEVFFVMTPKLLKDAMSKVEIDIFFGIHGFDVNVIYADNGNPTDTQQIILLKYSRYCINDLAKDLSKWSNYGRYRVNLAAALKAQFDLLDKAAAGNTSGDYDYINTSIRTDANWNGVLILNVPIADPSDLPSVFAGLTASQTLNPNGDSKQLQLTTGLNFAYVALPVNKTFLDPTTNVISIRNTAFYGLIDYDNLSVIDSADYRTIKAYLSTEDSFKFVLSKLLVRFENNEIKNFKSVAFVRVPTLFEEAIKYDGTALSSDDAPPAKASIIPNLVRLDGHYQKSGSGADQFDFDLKSDITLVFKNECVLASLVLHKASFSYESDVSDNYRFDFDGEANFTPDIEGFAKLIKFDGISFLNIGLSFSAVHLALPKLSFDVGKLFVLPKISFDCSGFLNSFPIRFNRFQWFLVKGGKPINYDFKPISEGHFRLPPIDCTLWGLVFDFDFGSLGDLGLFKNLKAELLLGWSKLKGFNLGLKLNGPSQTSIHFNLFGALRLDIEKVEVCPVGDQYMLSLDDVHLSILGLTIPSEKDNFSAMIFAKPGNKIAWFLAYIQGRDADPSSNKLLLSVGQRVGLDAMPQIYSVQTAIEFIKKYIFNPKFAICKTAIPNNVYRPEANWLVASDSLLDSALSGFLKFKFIFNDPILYGGYIELIGLFSIDILYRKLSDDVGMWSLEFALDPSLRVIDAGAMVITLPNLGVSISTNGDWRLDVGFPVANNWARSCMIQLRPFVGWAGMYVSRLRTAALSQFGPYLKLLKDNGAGVTIFQAGLAVRIGIGAYVDKGIFYVGASISVYGIVEGAFAFDKDRKRLGQLLPNAFALTGRIGAIAELVGYVDFKIIKAAIHIVLRVEFGMTLVYIEGHGLQPVPLYIEGQVEVSLDFTIACFKVFGHHFCITIHLSFGAYVRFDYTIGGDSSGGGQLAYSPAPKQVVVKDLTEIPVVFLPSFTTTVEKGKQVSYLIYNYAIPFFAIQAANGRLGQVSKENVIKTGILRPLFSAIYDAFGPSLCYQDMKNILLKGKIDDHDPEVEFLFPGFRPVFLSGFDTTTKTVANDEMLETYFHLAEEELAIYYQSVVAQDCGGANSSCLYRPLSIPISSKIKVVESGQASWESSQDGFIVSINGLFSDNKIHEHLTKTNKQYADADIDQIQAKFENYRSQYPPAGADGDKTEGRKWDLREDLAIPEYFRLAGLILLEMYYNYLAGLNANKNAPGFNPPVAVAGLFSDGNWEFGPSQIEALIGQINYFYNNGIRFADFLSNPMVYRSYFSMIEQTEVISGLLDETAISLKDVAISLWTANRTHTTDITKDLFTDENVLRTEFIGRARAQLSATPESIAGQFPYNRDTKAEQIVMAPYSLVDLELLVNNSKIGAKDGKGSYRFFEIPSTIAAKFPKEQTCVIKTALAENGLSDNRVGLSSVTCCNLSFKIKCHKNGTDTVSLELSNVSIDDLHLFSQVRAFQQLHYIESINLYDMRDANAPVKIGKEGLTIVKTNISPKTHPPIIIDEKTLAGPADPVSEHYFADITKDLAGFIRIMWEGLTTNGGGYYLTSGAKDDFANFDNEKLEYALMLSLEMKAGPANGYCNFLKIYDQPNDVFAAVENGYHIVCQLLLDKKDSSGQYTTTVKEYHPAIPAHCFSLELERIASVRNSGNQQVTDTSAFLQFIPVAVNLFDEAGQLVLDGEDTIPIMPKDKIVNKNKSLGKVYYNHVTPVRKYDSSGAANLDRYAGVNHITQVSFTVRDIYGFDFCDLPVKLNYRHTYFDKIVPIHAWPGLSISYWLDRADGDLTWKLSIGINDKAIKTISKSKEAMADATSQLNTIKAQLLDPNCKIGVLNVDPDKTQVKSRMDAWEIVKMLNSVLNRFGAKFGAAETLDAYVFCFGIDTKGFKTMLDPNVYIFREVDDSYFVTVPELSEQGEVWDFDAVKTVKTPIPLATSSGWVKGAPIDDAGKQLNESLKITRFSVGVGLYDARHVLFLVDRTMIAKCFEKASFPSSGYLGIRPYANRYWSGQYLLGKQATLNFEHIDLDNSLKVVLSKIDEWLSGGNLTQLSLEECVDILVDSKRRLVKGDKPSGSLSDEKAELSNKLDGFDAAAKIQSEEFENQLLKRLSNFYQTDGLLRETIDAQPDIAGHRFTISVNPGKDPVDNTDYAALYELDSSKVFMESKKQVTWDVFFSFTGDHQNFAQSSYKFNATPRITHIEYAIVPIGDMNNGIEKSEWIQLYEAVTLPQLNVDHFPVITRSCPPNPMIVANFGIGVLPDDGKRNWSRDLGAWRYNLGLRDSISTGTRVKQNEDIHYVPGDRLYIDLSFKTALDNRLDAVEERNFPGFLAYWSGEINSGGLDLLSPGASDRVRDFAVALKYELGIPPPAVGPTLPTNNYIEGTSLQLVIELKDNGKWKIYGFNYDPGLKTKFYVANGDSPEKHLALNDEVADIAKMVFGGFNVFLNPHIVSIKPQVWATRNEVVKNPNFLFSSDVVGPASWTTIHLKYLQAIATSGSLNSIYADICQRNAANQKLFTVLPFKSTVKLPIRTAALSLHRNLSLPTISIQQLEFGEKVEFSLDIDKTFGSIYENGFPAISLEVSNVESGEKNDLPIFSANTIFRVQQPGGLP